MEYLFSSLYPFLFVIALMGFGPQIYKLLTDKTSAAGFSFTTWIIWTFGWGISLGYGMTKLQDTMFCIVAAVNLAAHLLILGIMAYRRYENGALSMQIMPERIPVPVRIRR